MELISSISCLENEYVFIQSDSSRDSNINGLSKINIFVGENNSGKSRLLRQLLTTDWSYLPQGFNFIDWKKSISELIKELNDYSKSHSSDRKELDLGNIVGKLKVLLEKRFSLNSTEIKTELDEINKVINQFASNVGSSSNGIYHDQYGRFAKENMNSIILSNSNFMSSITTIPEYNRFYFPILRGLKHITDSISSEIDPFVDIYKYSVMKSYFNGKEDGFQIFTGLSSYKDIKDSLLGTHQQRKNVKNFESYIGKHFFEDKEVVIIPSESEKTLIIKIGDEAERPIHHLGDGIQTIILIILPLFLNQEKNLLVFIEEPEQYLHPGLQRKLIEALFLPEFKNYQYFLTTHSNHFLDITNDYSEVSIYTINKEFDSAPGEEKIPQFLVKQVSSSDHTVLELLGVKNSSVFLSNCTIWVEGITDRLYIRTFLSLYQKFLDIDIPTEEESRVFRRYYEDYHYSFVEYAGNNIAHWSFLESDDPVINVDQLCGKLFLITDCDSGKDSRHEKLRKSLGDRFYLLECREIENILSPKIINKVLSEYEKENKEFFNDISEYKDDYLGKKIDELIPVSKRPKNAKYGTDSGTLKPKVNFCRKAIKYFDTWEDVSEEAQSLTKKIYEFITSNNS